MKITIISSANRESAVVKCFLAAAIAALLTAGCGKQEKTLTEAELAKIPFAQREGLPECSGGLVLTVADQSITADELIAPLTEHFRTAAQRSSFEQFSQQVRPQLEQIISTKISNILLYQQAKKDAGENIEERLNKTVEQEVNKLIASFDGDYARAEESIRQMGMDWQSFRQYQKRMILSQSYIASQLPQNKPITYSELIHRYNSMKEEAFVIPATLKFRLIDIQPEKMEMTDPNQDRRQLAKSLAGELVRQISEGKNFGELAMQYSHDHRRAFGGLWNAVQPESLAEPYDILAAEAEKIQPGRIAGPIEIPGHIFIMKLEEKRPKSFEPFEKVQKEVEAKIIFERRKQAVDEIGEKLTRQAALGQKNEFTDFCLRKIYQINTAGD